MLSRGTRPPSWTCWTYFAPHSPQGCWSSLLPWWLVVILASIPKSHSAKLLSSQLGPSMYWYIGFFLPSCRTWHFHLLNFEIRVYSFLQPVLVPLKGRKNTCYLSHSSQFCTICKLLQGVLCSIVLVISDKVKQCWPQYWTLGYKTSDWPPAGLLAANPQHSQPGSSAAFSPACCPFISPVFHQLVYEDFIENCQQSSGVKINNIQCSFLSKLVISLQKVSQAWFHLHKSMLTTPSLALHVFGKGFQEDLFLSPSRLLRWVWSACNSWDPSSCL